MYLSRIIYEEHVIYEVFSLLTIFHVKVYCTDISISKEIYTRSCSDVFCLIYSDNGYILTVMIYTHSKQNYA